MNRPTRTGRPAADVRDRRISRDGGARLHYRDWGETAAPVVVLIPGSERTARLYDALANGLTDRFRVVVPELREHGEGDRAEDHAWEQAVGDIDAITRSLIVSPVSMVGHAIGAQLAAAYAARRPKVVMRLVLVDWAPGATFTPEDIRAPGDGSALWMDESTASALLGEVLCPTLLIRAAESRYITQAEAERAAGRLRDGRLVTVPECGHGLPWEQPGRLLGLTRAFLAPDAEVVSHP